MATDDAEALEQVLEALRRVPFDAVSAADDGLVLHAEHLETVGRLVDARRAQVAAEIAERSRREFGSDGLAFRLGHGKPEELLRARLRITAREAKQRIRVGSAIRPRIALDGSPLPDRYPTLAPLLMDGAVGLTSAELVITGLEAVASRAEVDDLDAAEVQLSHEAATVSPDSLAVEIAVWREALDPDGAEPREDLQREARSFRVGRERPDGMTPISMLAHPEAAGFIRGTLDAYGRKLKVTCDGDENSDGDNDGHSAVLYDRSRRQQDFDSVLGVLKAGVRADHEGRGGPGDSAVSTLVAVHVTGEDLASGRGAGWIEGVTSPVSATTTERLTCSGGAQVLLTTHGGTPLELGRKRRTFNRAQRRAIAGRDGGCAWPGCTAPASWTDVHHVKFWGGDGDTDPCNGVLLCEHHHHFLHRTDAWRIEMHKGVPYLVRSSYRGTPRPEHRMQQHPIQRIRDARSAARATAPPG